MDNKLVQLGNGIRAEGEKLPSDQFGFFVGKNGSSRGVLRARTGISDFRQVGSLLGYNGEERLHFWREGDGQTCNEIRYIIYRIPYGTIKIQVVNRKSQ